MDLKTAMLLQAIAKWIAIGSVSIVVFFVLLHLFILHRAMHRAKKMKCTEEGLRYEQLMEERRRGKQKRRRFKGKSRRSKRG